MMPPESSLLSEFQLFSVFSVQVHCFLRNENLQIWFKNKTFTTFNREYRSENLKVFTKFKSSFHFKTY